MSAGRNIASLVPVWGQSRRPPAGGTGDGVAWFLPKGLLISEDGAIMWIESGIDDPVFLFRIVGAENGP